MKAIFVALLFVATAYAGKAGIQAEGPACPLADPLISAEGALNITLEPILVINEGGSRGELVAIGLSTLTYSYNVNLITLAASFHINLPSIDVTVSDYNVVGKIDVSPIRQETLPSGEFTGTGTAKITATNVVVDARAALFVNVIGNRVSIRELTVETFSFDSISADLGTEYIVAGAPVDWAQWSATFKDNFAIDWAQSKLEIVEKIRLAANVVVGEYTLQELLELIGNIGGGGGDGGEGCPTPAP